MSHRKKPYIYLGRRVCFNAECLTGTGLDGCRRQDVIGFVTYINRPHRWFLVDVCGLKTSFFFSDLGKEVFTVGT